VTDAELLHAVEELRDIMISVATGGSKMEYQKGEFTSKYDEVAAALMKRQIPNSLPYRDLSQWYGRWSSGDLPTYESRRLYTAEQFAPVINRIQSGKVEPFQATGWPRVDRTVGDLRDRLAAASVEEDFQVVALICREALISLAQAVYVPELHPILDGVAVSNSDAKRMLDAYIAVELVGGSNDEARKHARSALDLSLNLQYKRTADFRTAAICVEATTAVINIIAIMSGRRDPQ